MWPRLSAVVALVLLLLMQDDAELSTSRLLVAGQELFETESDCYSTLGDLRFVMEAEFFDNAVYQNGTNSGPYLYILCPDTTFKMGDPEDAILPLLDNTEIRCGLDGKSTNNCIVEETEVEEPFPELVVSAIHGPIFLPSRISITGVTFSGARVTSAGLYGQYPDQIYFTDCHWKDHRAFALIDIRPLEMGPIRDFGTNGMVVIMNDCSIENEKYALNANEQFIPQNLTTSIGISTIASTIFVDNMNFRRNTVGNLVVGLYAGIYVQNSTFVDNDAFQSMFYSTSIGAITHSRFADNQHLAASVSILDSGVNISLSEFENNEGLADIIGIDDGKDGQSLENFVAFVDVDHSCFKSGTYATAPIFIGGEYNLYKPHNNYVTDAVGQCQTEAFLEPISNHCLDEYNVLIPGVTCEGICIDGGFDASSCPIDNPSEMLPQLEPEEGFIHLGQQLSLAYRNGEITTPPPSPLFNMETTKPETSTPTGSPTSFPTGSPAGSLSGTLADTKADDTNSIGGGSDGVRGTAASRSGGTTSSSDNGGFCQRGGGRFVCIGFPIIIAILIVCCAVYCTIRG